MTLVSKVALTSWTTWAPADEIPTYTEGERELSVKLFATATLESYLKGRCLSLVKRMAKSKDGFKLWRALVQE